MFAYQILVLRLTAGALGLLGILAVACASNGNEANTEDVVEAVPFESGEHLVYELVDAAGKVVGRGIFTATIQGDTFVLVQSYEETDSVAGERPILDVSTAVVDRSTLKPLTTERVIQRRNATDDESYSAIFRGEVGEAPLLVVTQRSSSEERTRELDLRRNYYGNESALWIWRSITLKEDFDASYVSVNVRDGSQATARLVMVDQQTLNVPAGTFDTWRLQVRNGRDTRVAWIHVESPHEIVQWDNGVLFLRLISR